MIYPICVYGSGVLRAQAQDIDPKMEGLEKLLDDMFETMYDAEGVGLAAPQIGKGLRLFVIDTSSEQDEDDEPLNGLCKAFINPEIYEYFGDDVDFQEGCLSIPGVNENVVRPNGVRVRYLNEDMELCDDSFEGMEARVIQHEYDHLEGEMFVDKLTALRKTLLKGKLSSMAKGKYSARYKTKMTK